MGKKRKAHGSPFGEPTAKSAKDESKLIVNSYQDVADSGDEFDLARDKILIDETPADRTRRELLHQGTLVIASDRAVTDDLYRCVLRVVGRGSLCAHK